MTPCKVGLAPMAMGHQDSDADVGLGGQLLVTGCLQHGHGLHSPYGHAPPMGDGCRYHMSLPHSAMFDLSWSPHMVAASPYMEVEDKPHMEV